MKYRVILQPRALADLEEQFRFIAERSLDSAIRWFNRFVTAIESLDTLPQRCPIARESALAGREIRQLLVGKRYGIRRVYFVIEQDTVRVVCIRHSARSDATVEDLGIESDS